MHYHYIFKTYKGKSTLLLEFKDKIGKDFALIDQEKGFALIAHAILEDHVHLLLKQQKLDKTDYVMRMFKGISSRRFFKEFRSNRLDHRKLWGRGYFARPVPEAEVPKVVQYIKEQVNAHGFDKRY
ncbi:MAG: IS200/IS605 family transposase [Candidatus Saganbacteria bacterium]|nr:IS200/IS605 family transposase [Candidatus Saganbacteria bacterium]